MAQENWIPVGGMISRVINYGCIGIDMLSPGPNCPKCGKHTHWSGVGGFMEIYQGVTDIITGYKPEHVCLNMKYPNPKYNPNKKMQREPKFIPCEKNYKFEWNSALRMSVPRVKQKETFYRPLAPGFPARKVTKI